jgi:hypothetical protein
MPPLNLIQGDPPHPLIGFRNYKQVQNPGKQSGTNPPTCPFRLEPPGPASLCAFVCPRLVSLRSDCARSNPPNGVHLLPVRRDPPARAERQRCPWPRRIGRRSGRRSWRAPCTPTASSSASIPPSSAPPPPRASASSDTPIRASASSFSTSSSPPFAALPSPPRRAPFFFAH